MTLAPTQSRGKYLAFWIVSRNLGQLVGGAIKYVSSRVTSHCVFRFIRMLTADRLKLVEESPEGRRGRCHPRHLHRIPHHRMHRVRESSLESRILALSSNLIIRLPFAFMIAPLDKVVRSDGTRVLLAETLSTKMEIKKIANTMTSKLIMLSGIFAFWTFFYK